MHVIAILREALRQLEQANDSRRDIPMVADLRYRMLRAVIELEAAEAIANDSGKAADERAPLHGCPQPPARN